MLDLGMHPRKTMDQTVVMARTTNDPVTRGYRVYYGESEDKKENIVFLLWGGFAQKKGTKIDRTKHRVFETGHPSPLSANRGFWFGNKHFSKTNAYLKSLGKEPIEW